jgi:cell division protein FtsB
MKWLTAALLIVVVLLQYRLWLSDDGVRELARLEADVAAQRAEDERLAERNRQLAAEVRDLKKGVAALEERARSELGMIARNETFYQVVPPRSVPAAETATRTAARPGNAAR